MIKINRKSLKKATQDEISEVVMIVDRLSVEQRMIVLDELNARNEFDLIEQINEKLNNQSTTSVTKLIELNKDKIVDHYHQLFDKKMETERIYLLMNRKFGIEEFEVQALIDKEIKVGTRMVLIGILVLIVGLFRIFAAAFSNQSSAFGFIIGFILVAGGIFSISSGRYKSRLSKRRKHN